MTVYTLVSYFFSTFKYEKLEACSWGIINKLETVLNGAIDSNVDNLGLVDTRLLNKYFITFSVNCSHKHLPIELTHKLSVNSIRQIEYNRQKIVTIKDVLYYSNYHFKSPFGEDLFLEKFSNAFEAHIEISALNGLNCTFVLKQDFTKKELKQLDLNIDRLNYQNLFPSIHDYTQHRLNLIKHE